MFELIVTMRAPNAGEPKTMVKSIKVITQKEATQRAGQRDINKPVIAGRMRNKTIYRTEGVMRHVDKTVVGGRVRRGAPQITSMQRASC